MTIYANQSTSDSIPKGRKFTVTVNGSALVERIYGGAVVDQETLTESKVYGPYFEDMAFRVSCFAGSVDISESADIGFNGAQALTLTPSGLTKGGVALTSAERTQSRAGMSFDVAARNADANIVSTIKPFGLIAGAATGGGNTRMMIFASKHPFQGVEIGYEHLGGNGAATGIVAAVAATDDPGPLNYALGNVAELKKMVTPKRGGSEYNTVSANGWQAATWDGASSATVADAGALKTSIAWTDLIPCRSVQAADGLYYGIIRWYEAPGPYTYGTYPGMTTGLQYQTDAGFAKIAYSLKGGDAVTTPGNWTTTNTLTITDSPGPNIAVRLHAIDADRPFVIMTCGDSRFDAVNEAPYTTTQAYASFGFKLARRLTDIGRPTHLIRSAQGGLASAIYFQRSMKLLESVSPDIALYIAYSINDGTPTEPLVSAAKLRVAQFVRRCAQLGVKPFIVSSYPRGGMTAEENTLLRELDTSLSAAGMLDFSPIAQYGAADGTWLADVSSDMTNHMKQAYYQDMAERVAAAIVDY